MSTFDIEYPYHNYNKFVQDMEANGMEVKHYEGRNFYQGPSVVVESIQDALSKTEIPCEWDNLGKQYIVYPKR